MQAVKRLMFLLFFLLLCFPSLSFAEQNMGNLSLSSTSGKAGSTITIYGSHFSSYEYGYIYLDLNNNGTRDSGEAYSSTTSSYYGSLTAYLTVPSLSTGTYTIRYSGSSSVNLVSYSVQGASISLTTTSGIPGSTFYVYGSNLPSYESGYVYLDANGNGVKDSGEWYTSTYSSYSGGFTAYMTVPTISAGTYNIRYSGTTSVSPVSFTVKRASLSISSTSGRPGSLVYVYGSNLPTYEYGYVYLDTNGNGVRDSGETYTSTSSSYGGSFTAYLTVPSVSAGTYTIRYSGTTSVSPISYTVQSSIKMTLNTTSGKAGSTLAVSGSSFPVYEYGYVYLDANGNGVRDSGEAYASTYSSYIGSFTAYLSVPSISAGTYNICYSGTSSVSPVSFTLLSSPKITLYSTSGKPGSSVTIYGSSFPNYESGYVYLDANGNGVRDSGEAYTSTYSYSSGSFYAYLTVPNISSGTYSIRYSGTTSGVSPVSYTIKKASLSVYSTSGKPGSSVTVYGTDFSSYESGYVYIDTNGNGVRDSGEAYTSTYTYSSGSFTAYLTVPNVSAGTYSIRYSGTSSASPVSYTILNAAKITTYTTSGKPGSTFTVSGSNFPTYESGYVYLDTNNNGVRDSGEAYTSTYSYSSGSFTAYLTVPSVSAGTYYIRYSGAASVSPISYTVLNAAKITTYTTSGKPGSTVTVYGSDFPSYQSGYVYLDANGNGVRDNGEAYSSTYSSYSGSFYVYLTVPSVSAGTYNIRYSGPTSVSPVSYTVLNAAKITTYTTSGKPGSSVTVYGSSFPTYESDYVYLDANGNGVRDSGEAYTSTYTSYSGSFYAYLTVPTVSAGTYNIRYSGTSDVSPVSYTVLNAAKITTYTTSGKPGSTVTVSGSSFPTYESGYVYLDTNGNGVRDSGEAYTSTYTSYSGSFYAYLTVPTVSAGTYNIRYSGTSDVSPVSYTVLNAAKITTYTTSGKPGSTVTVSGSSFPTYESGYVYLDANGNGVRDSGEAYTSTYSYSSGSFTAYLTVPSVSAGTYYIRYSGTTSVSPISYTVLNAAKITTYTTSGKPGSSVTVYGSDFPSYQSGYVYLDANGNGVRDSGEAYTSTYSYSSGSFTAYLTVPSVSAGTYYIRYSGTTSVSPISYTVLNAAKITTYTTSGKPGSSVTVYGDSFPTYESGYVYLDTNGNGVRDSGEAYTSTYTSYSGSFYAYLTVPTVSAGTYNIRYSGTSSVSPVGYTVLNVAKITTYTTSGRSGSMVAVYGSSFPSYQSGYVYLDTNRNGVRDSGEAYTSTYSYSSGSFTAYLTLPSVITGTYYIRYSGSTSVTPISIFVSSI